IYKKIDDVHVLLSTPKKEYVYERKYIEETNNVIKLLEYLETLGIIKKIINECREVDISHARQAHPKQTSDYQVFQFSVAVSLSC
ncbi:MAG: hypothetical protein WBZ36_04670, partial [Candidatus Nitrosopolaris sp.]